MEFRQALAAFGKDLHNPKVGWIKVIFFFLSGATGCLYPLLPLYMKTLGLRLHEMAIIRSLTPISSILGTYLAARLALKASNVKALLTGLTVLSALFPLLLLAVPAGRELRPLPHANITLTVFCGITSHKEIFLLPVPPVPRFSCHLPPDIGVVPKVRVGTCGHMCAYNLPRVGTDLKGIGAIELGSRFFVPEDSVKAAQCMMYGTAEAISRCKMGRLLLDARDYSNVTIYVTTHPHLTDRTLITVVGGDESAMSELWRRCRAPHSFHTRAWDVGGDLHRSHHCEHHCLASARSHDLCINHSMLEDRSVRLSFWLLLVLQSMAAVLWSLSLTLLEAAVGAFLRESVAGAELARQKQFGVLGRVLLPTAVGFLVDCFSDVGRINFTCLLLTFSGLELVVAICLWVSSLNVITEPQIPLKNVLDTVKNIELDTLLFTAFAGGLFSGFLDHFLLWRLEDLGAAVWLLELTVAVAAAASLPILVLAEPLVARLGSGNLVAAGVFTAGCKLLGYSLLTTPELCLLLELCEPLVGPLFLSAVLRYSRNITSKSSADTASVLVATAHCGLGRGICGALIGGLMYTLDIGFPQSAQILGGCALGCALIYTMFWHCCFKYVRQAIPDTTQTSQRGRWGSVRYFSFRRSRLRRAVAAAETAPPSKPELNTIEENKPVH